MEMDEHLVSHHFFAVCFRLFYCLCDQGICILALPVKPEVPGLMIGPSAQIRHLLPGCANPPCKHFSRALNTVTESRHLELAFSLHGPAQNRHWIRIVQKYGVRTIA